MIKVGVPISAGDSVRGPVSQYLGLGDTSRDGITHRREESGTTASQLEESNGESAPATGESCRCAHNDSG